MASITIRNLDDEVKAKLRLRAAYHGRSMEEEVRVILAATLSEDALPTNLGETIHQRFLALGGLDLPELERESVIDRPLFDS